MHSIRTDVSAGIACIRGVGTDRGARSPDDRQREDCRRIAGSSRVTPLAHREILSALNINLSRASIVDRSVLVSYITHVDRVVYVLRKLFI